MENHAGLFCLHRKAGEAVANAKNLIPLDKRTQRERKEIAKKGAAASNEVQRRKKNLREAMKVLLEKGVADQKQFDKVIRMGIDTADIDNTHLLAVALFQRAAKGDVAAFKEIRDLIGDDSTGGEVKIIDDYEIE